MGTFLRGLLYWTPRALCIAFAAFISIFALDVFREGVPVWQVALALLMHLIPTFLIVAILVVSWRHEWVGGVLYILLGVLYVAWAWGKPFARASTFALIAGPPILVGVLFLLGWRHRARLRPAA